MLRRLSDLQAEQPMTLVLARGHFCPKDHQQPLLTVLGVVSVLMGSLSWTAADKELRALAPRTISGGLACRVGCQLAVHFAR